MKQFLTLIIILFNNNIFGQNLPKITPPSPTAFQMTRFGNIPVNESSGKINHSIPLYTYIAGKLQLPISLNYQGNGVKVDQASSWTGINWNLNAGGVITRVIKDVDDFITPSGRQFYNYNEIMAMDFTNLNNINTIDGFINGGVDSQVDVFNFSFPGYSGGFYLDENLEPHLFKNDTALKIEISEPPTDSNGIIQNKKREITITTPEGVKYFFGGLDASEESRTIYPIAGGGLTTFAQTSFYLTKIQHSSGDEIYFEYITEPDYLINVAVSEIQSLDARSRPRPGTLPPNTPVGSLNHNDLEILRNKIKDGQFLSRIYSNKNSYEIIFNKTNIPNTNLNYRAILNFLTVRNSLLPNNELIHVNFNYLYPTGINSSQRFFLDNVDFNDGRIYKMEYNDMNGLPNRFDYDQDHLGYFNNKNNSRFLPKTSHPKFQSSSLNLSDKSADFEYASKGALIKIIYPTGGYTSFEYEAPKLGSSNTETKHKHFIAYRNDTSISPINKNPNGVSIGGGEGVPLPAEDVSGETSGVIPVATISAPAQDITIKMSNVISKEQLDQHVIFKLTVFDNTTGLEVVFPSYGDNHITYSGSGTIINDYYSGNVHSYSGHRFNRISLLADHSYRISLEIIANSFQNDTLISATISFDHKINITGYQDDYGIRIKEIANYDGITVDDDGAPVTINKKIFIYRASNRAFIPKYLYSTINRVCLPVPGVFDDVEMIHLSSSSISSIYSNINNEKAYRIVQIHQYENTKNSGYIEKEFILHSDALIINALDGFTGNNTDVSLALLNFSNQRENKSIINGTLIKETIYKKLEGNNKYEKLKETTNSYYFNNNFDSKYITNNVRKVLYSQCANYGDDRQLSNLYLGLYNTYSNTIRLDATSIKIFDYNSIVIVDTDGDQIPDYLDTDDDGDNTADWLEDDDGDSVANFLDSDYNPDTQPPEPEYIETLTKYEYNEHIGLPTKITDLTSENGVSYESNYVYPSLATAQNSAYGEITSLFVNNQISQPLETNRYKITENISNKLLSTTINVYDDFHYTNKSYLSKVQTSKGTNPLEDRIIYHNYDSKGNPLEISKANGQHICYVWGYNKTYPIAKIENMVYADIPTGTLNALENFNYITGSESQLLILLDNLRGILPNVVMITTMTYKPLIGMSTVTDPKGDTQYYYYDNFNRLEFVKDKDDNILSKNQYHYRP